MNATTPRLTVLVLSGVLTLISSMAFGRTHAVEARGLPIESSPGTRVRSSHAYLRAMIDEAILRSPTFRRIVSAIEATNGIVYVEHGACVHGVRACLTLDVTAAGGFRFLRVIVDARQPDWDVMASIGHELRHALEVLEQPAAVDDASVFFLFAQDRAQKDRPFETRAATEAGYAVRNEVGSFARGRVN